MHHPENIPPALSFRFRVDGKRYCVAFRAAAFIATKSNIYSANRKYNTALSRGGWGAGDARVFASRDGKRRAVCLRGRFRGFFCASVCVCALLLLCIDL